MSIEFFSRNIDTDNKDSSADRGVSNLLDLTNRTHKVESNFGVSNNSLFLTLLTILIISLIFCIIIKRKLKKEVRNNSSSI